MWSVWVDVSKIKMWSMQSTTVLFIVWRYVSSSSKTKHTHQKSKEKKSYSDELIFELSRVANKNKNVINFAGNRHAARDKAAFTTERWSFAASTATSTKENWNDTVITAKRLRMNLKFSYCSDNRWQIIIFVRRHYHNDRLHHRVQHYRCVNECQASND